MYWSGPKVLSYANRHGLKKYSFDGCRYGLRSPEGMYVRKPWTVMTNNELLGQKACNGGAE
eukprot:9621075-Prorocentrum_lima.AAC.1